MLPMLLAHRLDDLLGQLRLGPPPSPPIMPAAALSDLPPAALQRFWAAMEAGMGSEGGGRQGCQPVVVFSSSPALDDVVSPLDR
jgi:hypothetical protein